MWPATEHISVYGPVVEGPDERIYMDPAGDPIRGQEGLQLGYVQEYEGHGTMTFTPEADKKRREYYEG